MTLGGVLRAAEQQIDRVDARALLCHVTARDAAFLIAQADAELTQQQQERYENLVARRVAGEPVAYLTGEREFFGRAFKVTPAVLIPRPETELLVELALDRLPADRAAHVLDLGTGSGCIGITVALERPRATVVAVDRAADALEVARGNAVCLHASEVEFIHCDWYSALQARRFDIIVSNPPYVARGDRHLAEGDLRFEPDHALEAGADGLDCIRTIVCGGAEHLNADGWILFEHGYDQAAEARALLTRAGYADVFSAFDLAGIERASGGRLHHSRRGAKLMPDEFSRI